MARVVRKVSNKATKGQKRGNGLLHSKKFWIIVISIIVVLAAVGITIGVIVANNNKKKDSTVEVDDYFGTTQRIHDTDVNFTKMTYQGVCLHTNPEEGELFNYFTFVFAADLATFYPEDIKDDDEVTQEKNIQHENAFRNLVELQYVIDKYNETAEDEYKVALYIVNSDQVDGNTSYNIYSDSKFVAKTSSETLGPLFTIIGEDGIVEKVDGKAAYSTSFSESDDVSSIFSAVNVAINLVKNKNFDQISYYE